MRSPALLPCTLLLGACAVSGPGTIPAPGTTLQGDWGGEHVALQLSASGGRIEYDCAHGTLDTAIAPDADGGFRVRGRHVREQGGPVREGVTLPAQAAWYEGRVAGERMQLRVRLDAHPDDAGTLGPFTLQRGVAPQLFKCL